MMEVLANTIVVITFQHINASNQYTGHLKLTQHYISVLFQSEKRKKVIKKCQKRNKIDTV